MLPIFIRWFFSVVFLMSLMGKIMGLYCKTTFENYIKQLAGRNFYREVISVEDLSLSSNYQGSSCCSNHSSLKDKWSHNKQSSPMGYQVTNGGITRKLNKEPLLHCSSIYIIYMWSMLQQYVYLMSIHHASTSYPITHPHVFSIRPPYFLYMPWCHTFNLCCTCAHHVYTMRNPCPLTSFLTLTPSRLFLILLDPKSFQTTLDSVTWLPGHVPIS